MGDVRDEWAAWVDSCRGESVGALLRAVGVAVGVGGVSGLARMEAGSTCHPCPFLFLFPLPFVHCFAPLKRRLTEAQ